jgi:hypothetical protein
MCSSSPDVHAFLLQDSESFDEIATRYLNNKGQDLAVEPPKMAESLKGWMQTSLVVPLAGFAQVAEPPRHVVGYICCCLIFRGS